MKRKTRSSVLLIVLAVVFADGISCPAESPAGSKPNVLFIAVDDLNDWIGVLGGHPQAETPQIDRLAGMGTLFTRAYCAAPACNPSRVALMTGLRPSTTGIYHNPDEWRPVLPDVVTIPQHFRAQGYLALGSGKIYHDAFPDPESWDEYAPGKSKQKFADQFRNPKNLNGLDRAHFDWGPVAQPDEKMGDSQTVDYVVEQLSRERDQPFFLACGIYRPHLPWYVPEAYFAKFPLDEIQLPQVLAEDLDDVPAAGVKMAKPNGDHRAVVEADQWKQAVQGYLASIAFADAQVGRVLDAYDRSPAKEDTIIVLWSDHGWHLGEKQHWRKFALWEEATRVPLMIVAPGVTKAGSRCEVPVNLLDLYPTLIELCGLPERPELEGKSLVSLLKNPESEQNRYSVTTHGRNNHAVRSRYWRYIQYADGSEELYDHRSDPHEWRNLAGESRWAQELFWHSAQLPKKNVPEQPQPSVKPSPKRAGSPPQ